MALSACSQKTLKTQCGIGTRPCGDGVDIDGDGYCDDVDCNENDCDVHPGADETCDGFDDDCDGVKDNNIKKGTDGSHEYYIDRDFDGFPGEETAIACAIDVSTCSFEYGYLEDKKGKYCPLYTVDACESTDQNKQICASQVDCCDQDGDDGCIDGVDPACIYPFAVDGADCGLDEDECPDGELR